MNTHPDAIQQSRPHTPFAGHRKSSKRLNPWIVISTLALGGWTLDSLLMAIEMHGQAGWNWPAHLLHLWYGPPLLVAVLMLGYRRLPRAAFWVPQLPAGHMLDRSLRAEVRKLAALVAASPTNAAVLELLRRLPTTAMTACDLAHSLGRAEAEVEPALHVLANARLIDARLVCGLAFYRLTNDPPRLAQLHALAAWQAGCLEQVDSWTRVAGPRL